MVKLKEITDYIEGLFPTEYAEDFDNVGLLVGRADKDVEKVLLCLDANKNVISEAIKIGAKLVLTHHPVIFNPIKNITDNSDEGEMLLRAIENGISIYSAHTNLDSASSGLTDEVCALLSLTPVSNLDGVLGRLCTASAGATAKSLCEKIKKEFGIKKLYSTFTKDREIKTVAVCNGSGSGELCSISKDLGADVYISGDLKHHEMCAFNISDNIDFIEMRHFDSEKIVTKLLKRKLDEKFEGRLFVCISEAETSPIIDTDEIL